MKCKSCGAEISETSKFCGICGAANTVGENADDSALKSENNSEFTKVNETELEDKSSELDDILNKYSKSSDESGESIGIGEEKVSQLFDAAEPEDLQKGGTDPEKENEDSSQQQVNTSGNNFQTGASPQYNQYNGTGGSPNPQYNNYPQNNQNGYYGQYGGGYPQNPAFVPIYPQPYPQNNEVPQSIGDDNAKGKKTKEKKAVSLGIAVFCIIMVLILSAICGYLIEVCLGNGINPLNPAKNNSISIIDISENQISEETENG